MALPNIFEAQVSENLLQRIEKLSHSTSPHWGKMDVAQMLAHCNVTYELMYEKEKHKEAGSFTKFMMKLFVKQAIVNEKPYPKNSRTGPQFIIEGTRDFSQEKKRLQEFILKTQKLGASHFDGAETHSFGKCTVSEWSNMMYKHLDHHLTQFGV